MNCPSKDLSKKERTLKNCTKYYLSNIPPTHPTLPLSQNKEVVYSDWAKSISPS